MSISVNNLNALRKTPQTEQLQSRNISYKANPNNSLERNPQSDTYEKKGKKNKIGIILGSIAAVAALAVGILYYKGKPAEGVERKFFERIQDGWNKVLGKCKNVTENNIETKPNEVNNLIDDTKNLGEDIKTKTGVKNEGKSKGKPKANRKNKHEKSEMEKLKSEKSITEADINANSEKLHEVRTSEQEAALVQNNKEASAATADANKIVNSNPKNAEALAKAKQMIEAEEAAKNLNFDLNVEGNKIIVENGKIKKCINSLNEEWHITEETDKDFVQKINDAVAEKIAELQK